MKRPNMGRLDHTHRSLAIDESVTSHCAHCDTQVFFLGWVQFCLSGRNYIRHLLCLFMSHIPRYSFWEPPSALRPPSCECPP